MPEETKKQRSRNEYGPIHPTVKLIGTALAVFAVLYLLFAAFSKSPEKQVRQEADPSEQVAPAKGANNEIRGNDLETRNAVIRLLRYQITKELKDPSSAQFRNLEYYQTILEFNSGRRAVTGRRVLCGEVNAKNAFGGYVGFKPFVSSLVVSSETGTVIEDSRFAMIADSDFERLVKLFLETQRDYCRNRGMRESDIEAK